MGYITYRVGADYFDNIAEENEQREQESLQAEKDEKVVPVTLLPNPKAQVGDTSDSTPEEAEQQQQDLIKQNEERKKWKTTAVYRYSVDDFEETEPFDENKVERVTHGEYTPPKERSFFDDLKEIGDKEQEIPFAERVKESMIASIPLVGPYLVDDPKLLSTKNMRATTNGIVRGATLGWVDIDGGGEEDVSRGTVENPIIIGEDGKPARTSEDNWAEQRILDVFGKMGEFVGFGVSLYAGGAGLGAVTGLGSLAGGMGATSWLTKEGLTQAAKLVAGETLLGAGVGAVTKLEENESRIGSIATNAAIFGVFGTVSAIAMPFKARKVAAAKAAEITREYGAVQGTVNRVMKGAVQTHATYGESMAWGASWELPEISAVVSEVAPNELKKIRGILGILSKKSQRLAAYEKEIFLDGTKTGMHVTALDKEIGMLQTRIKASGSKGVDVAGLRGRLKEIRNIANKLKGKEKRWQTMSEEVTRLKDTSAYRHAIEIQSLGIGSDAAISPRGVVVDPLVMETLQKSADISKFKTGYFTTLDPRRMATGLDGGDANGLYNRLFIRPAEKSASLFVAELNDLRTGYRQAVQKAGLEKPGVTSKLFDAKKFKNWSERSARVWDYAESKLTNLDEIAKITPEEHELIALTKGKYGEFLERINGVRKKFYLEPIAKRADYVTHTKELNFLQKMGKSATTTPTKIIDGSFLKSTSPVFRWGKQRMGGAFDKDIAGAFNKYIDSALRQIHFTPVGSQTKAYAEALKNSHPNASKFWNEWVDEALYGNKTSLENILEEAHPMLNDSLTWFAQRTSRGAIVGNLSTLSLQPSTALTTVALTDAKSSLRASVRLMSKEGQDFVRANSQQSIMREVEMDVVESVLGNVEKGANWLNKTVDHLMVGHSFLAGYDWALKKGLSEGASKRYADYVASTAQATYNKIFTPRLLRAAPARAFAQFQTFTYNLWNTLITDSKHIAMSEGKSVALKRLAKVTAGMLATNHLWDSVGMPVPYEFSLPVDVKYKEDEYLGFIDKPVDVSFAARKLTAPLGLVPLWGSAGKFGPPITAKAARAITIIATSEDSRERWNAVKELGKLSPLLVPGGNQLRKTMEGILAIKRGYKEIGRQKVPIGGIFENTRAILYGPTQTKAVRKVFEERSMGVKKKDKRKQQWGGGKQWGGKKKWNG